MGIYRFVERVLIGIINFFWDFFIKIHELKNIIKKRNIYKKYVLTKQQKQQIDEFYKKNYGKKIYYFWHRLYASYTGKFDYRFLPEYIFSTQLEKIGNRRLNVLPIENKNMLNTLFENASEMIHIPKIFIARIRENYFDEDNNPISEEEAVNILDKKYNDFIIKASLDSNSGRGIRFVSLKKGIDNFSGKKVIDILREYSVDFIVQELIQQDDRINAIYSGAINTLRVITYITESGYHVAPIVMRIGQGGNKVDNAHAGGMFIAVDNKGKLQREAFTEYQKKYTEHPDTKLVFEGYQIPNIDILTEEIVKLHKRVPNIKFVSWDIALNNDNTFSLVECNLHSQAVWIVQMAHGKGFFEENTEEILRDVKK